jgi:hypothetical protein
MSLEFEKLTPTRSPRRPANSVSISRHGNGALRICIGLGVFSDAGWEPSSPKGVKSEVVRVSLYMAMGDGERVLMITPDVDGKFVARRFGRSSALAIISLSLPIAVKQGETFKVGHYITDGGDVVLSIPDEITTDKEVN